MVNRVGPRLDYGDGAYLEPLRPENVTDLYVEGLNDPDVFKFLGNTRHSRQTRESVMEYVRANMEAPDAILFGNYIGDVLRGTVRLHDVDIDAGTATVGTVLFDKSVWGQGWGSRALQQNCTFCFEVIGLQKLFAGIYACNEGSRSSFRRAGFLHDATLDRRDDFDVIETWIASAVPVARREGK